SGGVSQSRGGPATRVRITRAPGYEYPVRLRYFPIRAKVAAAGMQGGQDGSLDIPIWNGRPVDDDHEIMRDGWATFADPEDELILHAPAGAGFGPPQQRSPEAVENDLLQQLITPNHATTHYGYEI